MRLIPIARLLTRFSTQANSAAANAGSSAMSSVESSSGSRTDLRYSSGDRGQINDTIKKIKSDILNQHMLNFALAEPDGSIKVIEADVYQSQSHLLPASVSLASALAFLQEMVFGASSYINLGLFGATSLAFALYAAPRLTVSIQPQIVEIRFGPQNKVHVESTQWSMKGPIYRVDVVHKDAFQMNLMDGCQWIRLAESQAKQGHWCVVDGTKMWLNMEGARVNNHLFASLL